MSVNFKDTEADTCRKFVLPVLYATGWDDDHIAEQHYITNGKIKVVGNKHIRMKGKKPDYILLHTPDYPIAVIEAKAFYKKPSDGLGQAKEYAEILDVKFAYSTNGNGIVEFDYTTGQQKEIERIPTPEQLWKRFSDYRQIEPETAEKILHPNNRQVLDWNGKPKRPRYYQQIAINRACEAIFKGRKRALLTMATGTGKTFTAMQIIWKVWDQKWNLKGKGLHPKILYLADRNILVDEPRREYFDPVFGNAVHKISGEAVKGREIYFGIYQALAESENKEGLYKQFDRDFFDLIIVDECHRGSAREDSTWREILEYFQPATQIGMTATPKHYKPPEQKGKKSKKKPTDNIDTYKYFGEPIYTYSLRQGIEDGFLAPYRVKRVVTNVDAKGIRFPAGTLDKNGNEIPDKEFTTTDFERILSLPSRNEIAAKYLVDYLNEAGIFDNKTIIFCVDQEHALVVRDKIRERISGVLKEHSDFCERVTCEEGNIGLNHLGNFKDVEKISPGILTSSQMLTTGVDMPTVKNVVLFATINSIVTFKQIIGRGTRIREDKDKLWFTIIDFTGATKLFADTDFDGPSEHLQIEIIGEDGEIKDVWAEKHEGEEEPEEPEVSEEGTEVTLPDGTQVNTQTGEITIEGPEEPPRIRKYYIEDGVNVWIVSNSVMLLDPSGKVLQTVEYREYVAGEVKKLFTSSSLLESRWTEDDERLLIVSELEKRGIHLTDLQEITGNRDADPFDLLLHVAYNTPLKTRREKANRVQREYKKFFEKYQGPAREILQILLEKYTEFGSDQLLTSEILEVPPITKFGTPVEIFEIFGGPTKTKEAMTQLYKYLCEN